MTSAYDNLHFTADDLDYLLATICQKINDPVIGDITSGLRSAFCAGVIRDVVLLDDDTIKYLDEKYKDPLLNEIISMVTAVAESHLQLQPNIATSHIHSCGKEDT